jgi:hypothetical protein
LDGVGQLFSNLDGLSGVEGDKDTNNSMNNSHVLDHSVSHISNESDHDTAEAINDQLFWAATFDRCTSGNKIAVDNSDYEPTATTLTTQNSAESHLSARVTNPEFYKNIASKLAPSRNSSLNDNHPTRTTSTPKPSNLAASTSAVDTEMF